MSGRASRGTLAAHTATAHYCSVSRRQSRVGRCRSCSRPPGWRSSGARASPYGEFLAYGPDVGCVRQERTEGDKAGWL